MTPTKDKLSDVVDLALDAFWGEVAKAFPEADTGDIDPLNAIRLKRAATHAVGEWVAANVPDSHAHYDYELQAWVRHGVVEGCNHPEHMSTKDERAKIVQYCCDQRRYAGMLIAQALADFRRRKKREGK